MKCQKILLYFLIQVADGYLEIETPQRDENMVVHISEFINTLKSMVKI